MRISDWSSDVCSSDLCRLPAHVAGHEYAFVVLAFHKEVHGFAIRINPRRAQFTVVIGCRLWLPIGFRAACGGFSKRFVGVIDPQRQYFHTVAVFFHMVTDGMV